MSQWILPPSSAVIADVIRGHTAYELKDDINRMFGRVKCQCGEEVSRDFHPSHVAHNVWKYVQSLAVPKDLT